MDSYAPLIMQTAGYLTAALAVWILIRCAISMLQEKYEPEVWAYLEMPDGSSRPINNWECILGRSHSSDVVLKQRGVGRSHAALQRSARGRWLIYDLHSRRSGGTYVNGEPILSNGRLQNGDTIRLGEAELQFIVLSTAQRRTLQRRRREPGRRVRPGADCHRHREKHHALWGFCGADSESVRPCGNTAGFAGGRPGKRLYPLHPSPEAQNQTEYPRDPAPEPSPGSYEFLHHPGASGSMGILSRKQQSYLFLMASQYCFAACSSLLGPYS